ncbi:MAG: hypothetical protein ACP5P0_00540 [Hydrogenobacter sp.]
MESQNQQPKPQQAKPQPKKEKKGPSREDYVIELDGKLVEVHMLYGTSILKLEGIISADARFNIKLKLKDGKTIYINKAFIVAIEPITGK